MPENRSVRTCVFMILFATSLVAQKKFLLRGELQYDGRVNDLQVELITGSEHFSNERVHVAIDGSFTLREAAPGTGQIRVLNRQGEAVFEQYVSVAEGMVLTIRMPVSDVAHAPVGAVSMQELRHPTPPKAFKEYVNAKKAAAAGDFGKAIAHYQRAVELHPQYMQAWNDLGATLLNQNRIAEAADAFRKAAVLAPASSAESVMVNRNLAVALFKLK